MELLYYVILIIIGAGMLVAASIQKNRDGEYSNRSKLLLIIGTVFIVCTFFEKLPYFIRVITEVWQTK